jgi:hypothetical protein
MLADEPAPDIFTDMNGSRMLHNRRFLQMDKRANDRTD